MKSRSAWAFGLGLLAVIAQGAWAGPQQVAAPAPEPAPDALPNPGAPDLAGKRDVPITGEYPAPVTQPGASPVTTLPTTVGPGPTQSLATPEGRGTVAIEPADKAPKQDRWINLEIDPDAYSTISAGKGLSLHKPMFLLPYTYSDEYHGRDTEVFYQISLKQRLFGIPLYLGYTQKSFWQAYNDKRSTPFREVDYNPEIFYRFIPADRARWYHLGADIGFEHESNGRDLPDSRSWNRLYLSPFYARDQTLIYLKLWYRLPEDKNKPRTDPDRDDNPDIQSYYGYGELTVKQEIFRRQVLRLMTRYNPTTGHGAVNLQYTIPDNASDPSFFWMFYLFQGYGEDLLNYNVSVFRVGAGFALAR